MIRRARDSRMGQRKPATTTHRCRLAGARSQNEGRKVCSHTASIKGGKRKRTGKDEGSSDTHHAEERRAVGARITGGESVGSGGHLRET